MPEPLVVRDAVEAVVSASAAGLVVGIPIYLVASIIRLVW